MAAPRDRIWEDARFQMFNIKFFNKMALLSMIQDNNGVGRLNCKLNEFRYQTAEQIISD